MIPLTPPADRSQGAPRLAIPPLLTPLPIESLHEANDYALLWLIEMARLPGVALPAFAFAQALRSHLLPLSTAARQRAAQYPYLLAGLRFGDVRWWREDRNRPRRLRKPIAARDGQYRQASRALARTSLGVAWHVARSDVHIARVVLGMSRGVADVIRSLSLNDLHRVAEHQWIALLPRWSDRPVLWQRMLYAARCDRIADARECLVHGLQVTGAELTAAAY